MILPPPHRVHPSFDFETYSEAGFVWNVMTGKWACLPNASQGKKGLQVVGAAVYAEHPSTEVLTLSYDLLDGRKIRRWNPSLPAPEDLFQYVAAGGLLAGWHTMFEYLMWNNVCTRKYGWPALPLRQLRCTMARCRAHGGPGALGAAAIALGWPERKDTEGKRLLDRFSIPRNPTKADPRKRILLSEDPEGAEALATYCDQDVITEMAAASRLPELSESELEYWLVDQEINLRGVKIDLPGVNNCIAIIDQAHVQYNAELYKLTGGAVEKASEIKKLTAWLHDQGVHTDSLDEESVDKLLGQGGLPEAASRALRIRKAVGSAAVKKVYAMRNTVAADGRLHGLYTYHAARTGRATGNGAQPANLPNSGPPVHACACGTYFGVKHKVCPQCGAAAGKEQEWSAEAAEFALTLIACKSMHLLEWYFGDAMSVVSACLRALFIAEAGHDMIGSDYNSIEAVVLAELAGEAWRQEVFRTHGKIYEMSASRISGVPFEEFMICAGYTAEQLQQPRWWTHKPASKGKHHPLRKTLGKVAELACFSPDTQVLTDRGYVDIVDVQSSDRLWDGIEWVEHEGVVEKGIREVITLAGVRVTPEHPISTGEGVWRTARELDLDIYAFSHAVENASRNMLFMRGRLRRWIDQRPWPAPHPKKRGNQSVVYDIINAGPRHRFTIRTGNGHLIVHNSGYQGWIGAWINFGADEFMTEPEMIQAILAWRAASPAIVEFWGGQSRRDESGGYVRYYPEYYGVEGAAVQAIQHPGRRFEVRGMGFTVRADVLYFQLLSGREIAYHKPRLVPGRYRDHAIQYEGWNTNPENGPTGWITMTTWGGKLVENCVSEGTLVLTPRGWVEVSILRGTDLVHDGVDFVSHGGVVSKSVQTCIPIDGVWMTPDHEVLTNDGWKPAASSPEPFRPDVRDVTGSAAWKDGWAQTFVGVCLRVRAALRKGRNRSEEGIEARRTSELRVQNQVFDLRGEPRPWDEPSSGIRSMALDERPMPLEVPSGVEELRRAWDFRLRHVAARIRVVLGRHGFKLPPWFVFGPNRQQPWVLETELSLDGSTHPRQQSSDQPSNLYSQRENDGGTSVPRVRRWSYDPPLPHVDALADVSPSHSASPHQSRVFDILNCGPRSRFVVQGRQGPFIVHNCVQATARDLFMPALSRLERAEYKVILHTYDEPEVEIPEGHGSVEEVEQIMVEEAPWAKGWPIRASGGWRGKRFRK